METKFMNFFINTLLIFYVIGLIFIMLQ